MIYSTSITSGKLGSAAANRVVILSVTRGLIYRVEVDFPPGCCGLTGVKIFDGGYQVWPSSRDDSFAGDAQVIAFDDTYLKLSAPFEFRIETVNLDDTWSHKVQVRLGMASNEAFMSRYMPSVAWEKFSASLKAAARDQERVKAEQFLQLSKELKELTDE